jgi:hypothetical protein
MACCDSNMSFASCMGWQSKQSALHWQSLTWGTPRGHQSGLDVVVLVGLACCGVGGVDVHRLLGCVTQTNRLGTLVAAAS